MEVHHTLLAIYRSHDPPAALSALVSALERTLPVRCAVWIRSGQTDLLCCHPEGTQLPDEVLTIATHLQRPEIFTLESLSPVGSARYPDSEMLVLPLVDGGTSSGTVVLLAGEQTFGDGSLEEEWGEVAEALRTVEERSRVLRQSQQERSEFQKRTQEMEALEVLGLSVNRTLDPKEVLSLVARFSRTLLGAHYAIVFTTDGGRVQGLSAVGTGAGAPAADDDPFARRVIEAGKPLVLGAGGEAFDPAALPVHERQRMQVGLGVPLALFGETFGALVVGYRDEYPITSRDTLLALTLAHHAAVAINNARLHSKLAIRSAELADRSDQLQRANEELQRVSLQKERFFTSISHELRTPLNGILGFQTLLLEGVAGELPDPARKYVEKANRSATNLLHLIGEILDYGKIDAGKVELQLRPVEPREMVEEAVSAVEPLITRKRIAFDTLLPESARPVLTDPDRVRQILINLLSNAVKFTQDGGEITLAAAVRGEPDGVDWLEISVRDTGPGIAPEDQETIFREFEQVAGTRGGTGLGLPISRKLARLLNGDLTVESELGAGSTFILRLPSRQEAVPDEMSSSAA